MNKEGYEKRQKAAKEAYRLALEDCMKCPSPSNWSRLHAAGKELERADHTARPIRRNGPPGVGESW